MKLVHDVSKNSLSFDLHKFYQKFVKEWINENMH